jgi:hypothetical protein
MGNPCPQGGCFLSGGSPKGATWTAGSSKIESKHRVRWSTIHYVRNSDEKEIAVPLELCIAGGVPQNTHGWQVALMAGQRIDGFDFEARFCDIDGVEREGWHRHVWSPVLGNASGKTSVTIFKPGIAFRDFLMQALDRMKVFCRKDGDSNESLSF